MSKFSDTISSLERDLTPLSIPRNEYLALCVREKVSQNLSKYDNDFNKLIKILEQETLHEKDLTKLLSTIHSFSQLIDHLYNNLIKSIEQQEKLFKD